MKTPVNEVESVEKLNTPVISVIMCVHMKESSDELVLAVDSILNQSFSDFEFIICDDASDAFIWDILKNYQQQDSRIRLIRNKETNGVAASLNRCISKAKGQYIARMDGDDISARNRLELQYKFLEGHPEYAFVGCNAHLLENQYIWGSRRMPEKPVGKDFLAYSPYIHPTIMGRRELFLHDGGYRALKKTWRCEDYEFFMRQFSQGYYGYNLQKRLYYYREDSKGYQKRQYRYCISEALIRFQGYSRIGMLWKGGLVYWLKPLFVGMVPKKYYYRWKRRQTEGVVQKGPV